jgi:hypothetical protein
MKAFADLANLPEDQRIEAIGKLTMEGSASSADKPIMNGFIVETPAKAARYIAKLKERFPGIRIIDQTAGPVPDTVLVRVGPPLR